MLQSIQNLLLSSEMQVQQNQLIKIIPAPLSLTQNQIYSAQFQLKYSNLYFKSVRTLLYKEFILFQVKDNKEMKYLKLQFCFDLKFLFLRKRQQKGKWTIQSCKSLIFERQNNLIELTNPSKIDDFRHFRLFLIKNLNQKGLHDQFLPIKQLANGNYASIYLIQNYQNRNLYASKAFVKEESYSLQNGKETIINQISILRDIQHKNIIRLHSVFESINSIYLNLEYMRGGELFDRLKYKGLENKHHVKIVMKSLLTGLDYLHSKGIVHRDIKLENILFKDKDSWECVIADFGFATKINTPSIFSRCGTPGYLAPQIVNLTTDKAIVHPVSDIFSCGVIFHTLLFGKPVFEGETIEEIIEKNKKCQIDFTLHEYRQLPSICLQLLQGMLQEDPVFRLSAKEALNHEYFHQKKAHNSKKVSFKEEICAEMSLEDFSEEIEEEKKGQCRKRKKMLLLKQNSFLKFKAQSKNHISKEPISRKQSVQNDQLSRPNQKSKTKYVRNS